MVPRRQYFLIYLSPAVLAFCAVCLLMHLRDRDTGVGGDHGIGEDTYREVLDLIENEYVTEVPRDALIYGAIKGMTEVLDRHSRGYDPGEWARFARSSEGRDIGIGIRFGPLAGGIRVLRVIPGSPAERGGLRDGDRLVAVGDHVVLPEERADDLRVHIVGPTGSEVTFEVESWASAERRTAVVKRGPYKVESVFLDRVGRDGEIAYIRIEGFNQGSGTDFRGALARAHGARGAVIDLRGNPGGSLPAAVSVVAALLETDRVLTSVYRTGSQVYPTQERPVETEMPIAVLVNGSSASASEIVAGAIQDYKRGVIVGEHTYGKGLVQNVYELRSRPAGIKITTARWLTPSGRSLQRRSDEPRDDLEGGGIVPDFSVSLGDADQRTLGEYWARLGFADAIAQAMNADAAYDVVPADFVDAQLAAALAILDGEQATLQVAP